MKRAVSCLLLLALTLLCLTACGGGNPWGDEVYGKYENREGYTLVLRAGGKGTLSHESVYGTETEESIVFDFEKDGTLVLHGTSEAGGVIGRTEFYGMPKKGEDGTYSLTLRAVESGIALSTFRQVSR
ncbi:MAG: hypothetical protein J6R89_07930 [Clostridia bacterium]|nr:hypothetical protein [Clostridia bacterium]